MGVCYAIVHDETREAFELGKSVGWEWLPVNEYVADDDGCPWPPPSHGALRSFFVDSYKHSEWADAEFIGRVTDAVWSFIQSHPGCRVEADTGDVMWSSRDSTWFREDRLEDPNFYVEIGSLYDLVTPR